MSSLLHAQVAARLRTIIDAATNVTVVTNPPAQPFREAFLVDFEGGSFRWPTMRSGTRPLSTDFRVRVGITADAPGQDPVAAQTRWCELADVVLDALRADPTLQATHGTITHLIGVVTSVDGEIRGPFTAPMTQEQGWGCQGDLLFNVSTTDRN